MLKAEGLSYQEIGERCGWTYTKVNRAITEGRRRFMDVYRAIETGDACERFAPVLAALAGGTATSAEIVEIRPHLRHCMACRATVRELHNARRQRFQLLVPAFVLAPLPWLRGRGGGGGSADLVEVQSPEEILLECPPQGAPEAGGRLNLQLDPERLEQCSKLRLGRIKEEALALLHRSNSTDIAAGIHIATGSGGGRISAIATLIGFCVSGAGAGALCVATGVVQAPGWIIEQEAKPAKPRAEAPVRKRREPARLNASVRATELITTRPSIRGHPAASRSLQRDPTRVNSRRHSKLPSAALSSRQQDAEFGFERFDNSPSRRALPTSNGGPPAATTSQSDPVQEEFGP